MSSSDPHEPLGQPLEEWRRHQTRRALLSRAGLGLGALALGPLLGRAQQSSAQAQGAATSARGPHHPPRVKRVIYLHMAGAPPQHDLFDYKPALEPLDRLPCPDSLIEGERFAFIQGHPKVLASPYRFEQVGPDAHWSELLPHLKGQLDKLMVVRSMTTDQFNHAPAQLFLHTGSPQLGRPSFGAWTTYGLGSEADDLPGFVVLVSGGKTPSAGKSVWGSGFLPSVHQGVQCRSQGDPVLFASNPAGMDRAARRSSLDALAKLNQQQAEELGDPETRARIAQYELAFRMQMSVPGVMDLSQEDPETLALYGAEPGKASYANNCLLARRLAESGVRFVQLYDWGWDTHGTNPGDDLETQLPKKCEEIDRATSALLIDLERRGLLEDTLVVWGGEFGRTCLNEERGGSKYLGRDHHPHCFTLLFAGGGVRAGEWVGATDELGWRVTDTPIHVHDLQATMLHLLGLEHTRLTYPFQGRDFRLTDVHGQVRPELLRV